jgi:sodium-dependent phosphate cotransporter
VGFLFAVQLLGAATDAAAPVLERLLYRVVVGDGSALALGWLGAYALANGSVVAALALSLFASGLLSAPRLFLLVCGSRLGGAAVVVFVGVLDFLGAGRQSLSESVRMGLLTFLVTFSIHLPATAAGYLAFPLLRAPCSPSVARGPPASARHRSSIRPRPPSPVVSAPDRGSSSRPGSCSGA